MVLVLVGIAAVVVVILVALLFKGDFFGAPKPASEPVKAEDKAEKKKQQKPRKQAPKPKKQQPKKEVPVVDPKSNEAARAAQEAQDALDAKSLEFRKKKNPDAKSVVTSKSAKQEAKVNKPKPQPVKAAAAKGWSTVEAKVEKPKKVKEVAPPRAPKAPRSTEGAEGKPSNFKKDGPRLKAHVTLAVPGEPSEKVEAEVAPEKEKEKIVRIFCFNCGKTGHRSPDCPDKQPGSKYYICFFCGDNGHLAKVCPKKEQRAQQAERRPKRKVAESEDKKDESATTTTATTASGEPKPKAQRPKGEGRQKKAEKTETAEKSNDS